MRQTISSIVEMNPLVSYASMNYQAATKLFSLYAFEAVLFNYRQVALSAYWYM
jgi:hypothetical protein